MNTSIWAIGLILQCLLLGALARRGVARRLPLFTALVGFYVVRSVFLFAAFGHLSTDTYSLTYQALSLMDIVFQVLVAWELFSGGRQYPPAPAHSAAVQDSLWRRLALFSALLVGSAAVTWGLSAAVPANPNVRMDRGVLLSSALMLAVAAVTFFWLRNSRGPATRRVLEGFAILAASGILAQIGRALAARHRDAWAYGFWSYLAAVAYLAVLLFWLVALPRAAAHPGRKRPRKKTIAASR
jgi:hypothetical protein